MSLIQIVSRHPLGHLIRKYVEWLSAYHHENVRKGKKTKVLRAARRRGLKG